MIPKKIITLLFILFFLKTFSQNVKISYTQKILEEDNNTYDIEKINRALYKNSTLIFNVLEENKCFKILGAIKYLKNEFQEYSFNEYGRSNFFTLKKSHTYSWKKTNREKMILSYLCAEYLLINNSDNLDSLYVYSTTALPKSYSIYPIKKFSECILGFTKNKIYTYVNRVEKNEKISKKMNELVNFYNNSSQLLADKKINQIKENKVIYGQPFDFEYYNSNIQDKSEYKLYTFQNYIDVPMHSTKKLKNNNYDTFLGTTESINIVQKIISNDSQISKYFVLPLRNEVLDFLVRKGKDINNSKAHFISIAENTDFTKFGFDEIGISLVVINSENKVIYLSSGILDETTLEMSLLELKRIIQKK